MTGCADCADPVRWAVVDIAYVREQFPGRTARQIADDLGVSSKRVSSLITRRGWRNKGAFRGVQQPSRPEPGICTALGRGTAAERGAAGALAAVPPEKRATGRNSAPPDLLQFINGLSEREAARALGLSKGSVGRLRDGYWPNDSRKLMAAWERYTGRRLSLIHI